MIYPILVFTPKWILEYLLYCKEFDNILIISYRNNDQEVKMKAVFDYINGNSFLTTIIGVIIGSIITSFTTIYVSFKDRKERKKEELLKEKRCQYENKAELKIISVNDNSNNKPDIEVFLAPFNVDYTNGFKNFEIVYPKDIKDRTKHKYKEFTIKNVGKSDINELDICATFKNHNALVNYKLLDMVVDEKIVDYNSCYDRKIMKGETIVIRVYYLNGLQVCHPISCTLAILFKDSFNNSYEQPFWYEKDNLYPPRPIDYKEYHTYITSDDAYYCFEHPYMW